MSVELVMPSNYLILCHPLLFLPSVFPSIRVFSNESVLHIRWPKYWSFSFSISPSNEYSGLISFRMDWLDLLAVQGTLKSLLQHQSSKALILWCSAIFMVQKGRITSLLQMRSLVTGSSSAEQQSLCPTQVRLIFFGSAKPVSVAFEKRTCSQVEKKMWHVRSFFKKSRGHRSS